MRKLRITRVKIESSQVSSFVGAKVTRTTERDEKGVLVSFSYQSELTWWIAKPVRSCHLPRVPQLFR